MKRCAAILLCLTLLMLLGGCASEQVQPPAQLRAALTEENAVALTWSANASGNTYRVYRKTPDETGFKYQGDVSSCAYTDTLAEAGYTYQYKVAVLWGAEELLSEQVDITIPGEVVHVELPKPETPVITAVTRMPDKTVVIQMECATPDVKYQVLRSISPNGDYNLLGTSSNNAYYDQLIDDQQQVRYYYRVVAFNDDQQSERSEPVAIGTNAQPVFGVPVLMYHEFVTQSDLDAGVAFDEYAIWADEFESDLIWLRDNGYTTITTADLISYMKGEAQPPAKPVILTIDDGKWGVYRNAWPLLQKYGMKAVLSVIGDEVSKANPDLEIRSHQEAPYCTWDELREMADSGVIEMISHTFSMHYYYYPDHPGRVGADFGEGENPEAFLDTAFSDYLRMQNQFQRALKQPLLALSYPYSKRSINSDQVWLECGYQILYSGNSTDDRATLTNYFVSGAGVNRWSAVIRRVARMHETAISYYLK